MRAGLVVCALALWQVGDARVGVDVSAMRYQRVVTATGTGPVCAVLDAAVFEHAASGALNDLRLFAADGGEVPFVVEVNRPADETAAAWVKQREGSGEELKARLVMPARRYSDVVLDIAATDFVAEARVWGSDRGEPVPLGSFVLYGLEGEGLGRSTKLSLGEAEYPSLWVEIHPVSGRKVTAALITGASVPPSRESQTIFTGVAESGAVVQRGPESVVVLRVPAHVPVERVEVVAAPELAGDFLRRVRVSARPDAEAEVEQVEGSISRVGMARFAGVRTGQVEVKNLSVDATLGANLRGPAAVEVAVENGVAGALPIAAVKLEMRRRSICFDAVGGAMMLRYGDAGLRAPVYKGMQKSQDGAKTATLGAEELNPGFAARRDVRTYGERHPECVWIVLLGAVAVAGGWALHGAKRRGSRG